MYTLGVRRDFIARHYLIGGDWGPENYPNSHHYVLELQLGGTELDQHGYLVDIVQIEKALGELVTYYPDKMLNDLPEFSDLNPSLEHFADSRHRYERTNSGSQHSVDQGCPLGEQVGLGFLFRETLAIRVMAKGAEARFSAAGGL